MGKIVIHIDFGRFPGQDSVSKTIEFTDEYISEPKQILDFDLPDSDVFTRLLCNSPKKRKRVQERRIEFATKITDFIIEALAKEDTICGYKKDN